MSGYEFAIYGNSIGAMISALELGKKHKVALVNPAPAWGAHFAGLKFGGRNYDIGMNFFEFTSFHQKSNDLLSYDPAVRNDSARFCHLIETFVTQRVPVELVPTPQCCYNVSYSNDFIMANKLGILSRLPESVVQRISVDLNDIVARGDKQLHASNKKKNEPLFLNTSYKDVSIANHGKTFHDLFIEPLCLKTFNVPSAEIPALFHRIAWAPLFYPETLLNELNNVKNELPETLFHYPKDGYFARFTEILYSEIRQSTNVTIFQEKVKKLSHSDKYSIHFSDKQISADSLVWCADLQALLSLNDIYKDDYQFRKASITLGFLNLDKHLVSKEFSTLYVCDDDELIYRITNQDYAARNDSETYRIVFEFNYDRLQQNNISNDEDIIDNIASFLKKAGIVGERIPDDLFIIKSFKNAINAPVMDNYDNFQKLYKLAVESFKNIEFVGMAAGFVATSFNDQVIQAMKLGVKYH